MTRTPHRRRLVLVGAIAAVAALLPVAGAGAHPRHQASHDTQLSLDWYDLTSQTIAAAVTGGQTEQVTQDREWAVSWLAAARATDDGHGRSFRQAAFITALHDTLVAQVQPYAPSQVSVLDTARDSDLAEIPQGPAKKKGVAAGAKEAAKVLAQRNGDGLDTKSVNVPWTPPAPGPGVYQPTPPFPAPNPPVVRAGLPNAKPFLLARNDQFRPGPPPALDSQTYLDSLAEVHSVGQDSSSTRTPHQTDVALFWEQSSIAAYNQVLRALLPDQGGLRKQSRLVAAFHVITIDAQIAIHEAKYVYVAWRPVTAIRTGSVDQDPNWTPLFVSPRHPEYPSGHTGYAGAAEAALTALVGARAPDPIAVTSTTEPGVTHTFTDWQQITQENIDGRVWEGVHFRFSDQTGAKVGRKAAGWDLPRLHHIGL
jgi:hypothetical protein